MSCSVTGKKLKLEAAIKDALAANKPAPTSTKAAGLSSDSDQSDSDDDGKGHVMLRACEQAGYSTCARVMIMHRMSVVHVLHRRILIHVCIVCHSYPCSTRLESDEELRDKGESIQKMDAKSRVTVRNLRIREDTAKYLRNLNPHSAHYDPKTRSMRDNPDPNKVCGM